MIEPHKIDGAEWEDLSTLVHRYRRRIHDLAKVPKHSGNAPSRTRKAQRKKRRAIQDELVVIEREIVQWANVVVPIIEDDFPEPGPNKPRRKKPNVKPATAPDPASDVRGLRVHSGDTVSVPAEDTRGMRDYQYGGDKSGSDWVQRTGEEPLP